MKKYRVTILMGGCIHPEGHRVRIYSTETDEAWWMGEAMALAFGDAGLSVAISFQSRESRDEPWVDGSPSFPQDAPI